MRPSLLSATEYFAGAGTPPPAPPGAWFGPDGCKLHTAAWRRHGVDTPATRNAAEWVFHTEPPASRHLANYPSIRPHLPAVAAYFDELCEKGLVEAYDSARHGSEEQFVTVINPLHVVPKGDADIRPITDPSASGVNACMAPLPCPLPSLAVLLAALRPNGFLGKRDLASGFHHVKLVESARRYMGFRHPVSGRLLRWVVLPFGASQSPGIFVEMTVAAAGIFQRACDAAGIHVSIFVYVDDFMIIGDTHEDVRLAFAVLDRVGAELGLEWKASKDRGRTEPLQQLDFLGMQFDTVALQMRMTPEKRGRAAAAVAAVRAAAAAGPIRRRDLLQLAGRLGFLAQACRWGYTFLQGLYDACAGDVRGTLQLSPAALADLADWAGILDPAGGMWDGVTRLTTDRLDWVKGVFLSRDGAVVTTDASGTGYGAWAGSTQLRGLFAADEQRLHVAWRELQAVLQALRALAPGQLRGKCVLVRSDNTQAVAAVNHGATRVPEGRPICREIALLAVRYGFTLRAEHLPGTENALADRLSRQLTAARDSKLQLRPGLFRRLCPAGSAYAPSVDCCCDVAGRNRQDGCSAWFSADRSVLGQAEALAGRVLWAFPPPTLVGEVLAEIWAAYERQPRHTRATVVVPDWPERCWHARWVRGQSPYRLVDQLPEGSRPCQWASGELAEPTPYALLVLRLP